MRLYIEHTTFYTYTEAQKFSMQALRLTPQNNAHQQTEQWTLNLAKNAHRTRDAYGNLTDWLYLDTPHKGLELRVSGVVETYDNQAVLIAQAHELPPSVFLRCTPATQHSPELQTFALSFQAKTQDTDFISHLSAAILAHVPFTTYFTSPYTTAAQAWAMQGGVCQDHVQIMLSCCRLLGVPARYVSGYLFDPDLITPQVASHAWIDVWQNNAWHSYDITNDCPQNEYYVRLAVGCDYFDACPIRGVRVGLGRESMSVEVEVKLAHAQNNQ